MTTSSECITVGVRIRPLNDQEKALGNSSIWNAKENTSIVQDEESLNKGQKSNKYLFDHAFDQEHDNNDVYERIGTPIINGVLDGFHGTIFAYGQTSSGKTHTLLGTPDQMGIIIHSIHDVFDFVHRAPTNKEFLIRVSYLEIYNEQIKDLLADPDVKNAKSLKVIDDPKKGSHIVGLKEVVVLSPDHILELLKKGEESRHYGLTKMNANSSRSHTVFRMVVECRIDLSTTGAEEEEHKEDGSNKSQAVQVSTLNLVDLAGSERVSKTEATGSRLKEGASINKSLLVLGTVINRLAEGKKGHIPFRDSKLTRLLKNSLGGNAKTAVVCTLSPAERNLEESKSTLQFASRAKTIVNKAKKNHVMDKSALLDQYRQEIAELKLKLASGQSVVDMPELDEVRQRLKDEENKRKEIEAKYENATTNHEKEKEEMRKLVLLTSKVAANSQFSKKMQEKIKSVASGEQKPADILEEVETLAVRAEEAAIEEEKTIGGIKQVLKWKKEKKKHLSSLCSGIVASMADMRKTEEIDEGAELWKKHLTEKVETLEADNRQLRGRVEELLNKDDKTVTVERFQSEVDRAESLSTKVRSLEDQLAHARSALQATQRERDKEVREAESKNLELMEKYSEAKKRINELEIQSQSTHKSDDLLETVEKQETQLQALKMRLETQQKESQETRQEQQQQLMLLKTQSGLYEQQIQQLQRDTEVEHTQLLAKMKQREQELKVLQAKANDNSDGLETGKIKAMIANFAANSLGMSNLHNGVQKLDEMTAKVNHLEGQLRQLRTVPRKTDHEEELKTLRLELVAAKMENNMLKSDDDEINEDEYHRKQRELALVREIESLKTRLTKAEEMSLQYSSSNDSVTRETLDVLSTQRDTLLVQLDGLTVENENMKGMMLEMERRNVQLQRDYDQTVEQLKNKQTQSIQAVADIAQLNRDVAGKMEQYELVLAEKERNITSLVRQIEILDNRLCKSASDLKRSRADAAQATDTFLEYQKAAEQRELKLKGIIQGSPGSSSSDVLGTQIQELQARLRGGVSRQRPKSARMTATAHYAKASTGHEESLTTLRSRLEAAQDELDVFRRLDIYSTSLKRGLGKYNSKKY